MLQIPLCYDCDRECFGSPLRACMLLLDVEKTTPGGAAHRPLFLKHNTDCPYDLV